MSKAPPRPDPSLDPGVEVGSGLTNREALLFSILTGLVAALVLWAECVLLGVIDR